MAEKRRCAGTIINPKSPRLGERCNLWSKRGSDYCNVHGGNHVRGVGHPETLEHRCVARKRGGKQCAKPAIAGGVVCQSHGAGSPFVRAKAQARLTALVDPALAVLQDLLTKRGVSDSDRMRIALAIVDRSGLGPSTRVEVGVEIKPWERAMNRIITDLTPDMIEAHPALGAWRTDDIQDAEVVEDEPEPERIHPREYLPQIVPPNGSNERATYRVGVDPNRPRPRATDERED
jgi:hypothetical protein